MTNSTSTPDCPEGLYEYIVTVNGVELTCHVECEPEERGSREAGTGLQLEPDYPATLTVCYVYAGSDIDLLGILGDDIVDDITTRIIDLINKDNESMYEHYF
jgi:hypothetical protein